MSLETIASLFNLALVSQLIQMFGSSDKDCKDSVKKPFSIRVTSMTLSLQMSPTLDVCEKAFENLMELGPDRFILLGCKELIGQTSSTFRRYGHILLDTTSVSAFIGSNEKDKTMRLSILDDSSNSNAMILETWRISSTASSSVLCKVVRNIVESDSMTKALIWYEDPIEAVVLIVAMHCFGDIRAGTAVQIKKHLTETLSKFEIKKVPGRSIVNMFLLISTTFFATYEPSNSQDEIAILEKINEFSKNLISLN